MSTEPKELILDGGTPFDDMDVIDGGDLDVYQPVESMDGGTPEGGTHE
jgi:hypothetical protein